ncbi:hypothetical protein ACLOJK_041560, partial [Asimina triloba]
AFGYAGGKVQGEEEESQFQQSSSWDCSSGGSRKRRNSCKNKKGEASLQMLSVENPPPDRPSCSSCKNPALKGDERTAAAAHAKLVLHEEEAAAAAAPDLGTSGLAYDLPLPHFSIRATVATVSIRSKTIKGQILATLIGAVVCFIDWYYVGLNLSILLWNLMGSFPDYVFNARSKDVGVNWPFPERFLQLCLKHGVKDILPPFEGPDSVRAQCSGKGVGPDKATGCGEVHETLAQGELVEKHDVGDDDGDDDDNDDDGVKCLPCWQVNQLSLESSDRAQSQLAAQGTSVGKSCSYEAAAVGTTTSTITSHGRADKFSSRRSHQAHRSLNEISASLETSVELEVADPHSTSKRSENSDRKCRLIVKLGGVSESSRTEEILSNSSAASEAMASKICPVCKTFSSTSNTTLNAHIDQCLAVESTSKRAVTDVTKHRVKLRKKRSMVDICATAPGCTLEDLDRRNGTNWALESRMLLMQNGEVRSESKRQRLPQVDFADDGEDCAVYFDSNGTKLRILSKFNDSATPKAGDDITPRKYVKDSKHGKSYLGGKRKQLAPKSSKYLKPKPPSKKLCSLKLNKDEIYEVRDPKQHMENHEDKEKSLSQLLKSRDPVKLSSSGTLRRWACSKRSGISRKASVRDDYRRMKADLATSANQNPLVETKQSTSRDSPAERSHILKFSRSSENPSNSMRSKRSEVVLSSVSVVDNGEESSKPVGEHPDQLNQRDSVAEDQILNFSRAPENFVSSPRSKRVEIDPFAVQSSSEPSGSHPFSLKAKKIITLRKNSLLGRPCSSREGSRCTETENSLAFKKPWKKKLLFKGSGPSRDFPFDANELCADRMHISSQTVRPSHLSPNKVAKIRKLDILNDKRFQMEEYSEEASIERGNMLDSGHTRDQYLMSSMCQETASLSSLDPPADCRSPGMADTVNSLDEGQRHSSPSTDIHPSKSDAQESAAVSGNVEIDSSEKAVESMVEMSGRAQSSYEDVRVNRSCMQSPSLEYEYACPASQTEPFEQHVEIDYDNTDMGCADEAGDEVTGLNSQMTGETDSRMEEDSLSDVQYPGFAACHPSIQGLGQCLPSTSDVGHDVLHDNASVTSGGPQFSPDGHRSIDLDPSRSPASPTSTISSPPNTRSDFHCANRQSLPGFPSAQDKPSMNYTDHASLSTNYHRLLSATNLGEERTVLERENPRAAVLSMKEFPKNCDDQPCCCSRKESTLPVASVSYQEPQPFRQRNFLAPMMGHCKTKQMISNSYGGQEISTSRSCLSSRSDEFSVPAPPAGSLSTKVSLDNAVRLTNGSDFESASLPSQTHPHQPSSNSFFRLMGKNLMVMNKDEGDCMQIHGVPHLDGPSRNDHANAKYLTLLGYSTSSTANQDSISFYCQTPNGSSTYCSPFNSLENFNIGFQNGFRNQSSSKVHQTVFDSSESHHHAMDLGGFMGSVLQPGQKSHKPDSQLQPKRVAIKPHSPFSYNVDSHISVSAAESTGSAREVIVIDDSPDVEADSSKGNGRYVAGSRGKQHPLLGIMPQAASNLNMKQVKSFSCLPLPVGQKPSFLMSCPGANVSSSKQGASEGSSIHSQSPFMLSSPPAGYLNSALYYSPSLR